MRRTGCIRADTGGESGLPAPRKHDVRSLSASRATNTIGAIAITATIAAARKISNGGAIAPLSVGSNELMPIAIDMTGPMTMGTSTVKHMRTPWNLPSQPSGI